MAREVWPIEQEGAMICQRCSGLMVGDAVIDMIDDSGHLWLGTWRCVNCGNLLHAEIASNRDQAESGLIWFLRGPRSRRIGRRRPVPVRLSA